MAKEFTQVPIQICGGEYYFKRCSNNTLKSFDEEMEAKIKEIEPLTKESELINQKGERLDKRIESTERRIRLMEDNDEDYKEILKLQDKLDGLLDDKEKHLKEVEEFNKEHENVAEELSNDLDKILANKMEAVLDGMTAKTFLDEADGIDQRIAANISKYYEMCMVGERESKILQEIRDDVEEFRRRQKSD